MYPCSISRVNVSVVPIFARCFHERPFCTGIGYSGHETGILTTVIAAVMGARYVERHITLDRAMHGSDHAASLEKQGLQRMVRDIRSIDLIMGSGSRELHGDEKNPITYWREA
jgi:N-acetylneuraminate synthase